MCGPGARSTQSSCSRLAHEPARSMTCPRVAAAAASTCPCANAGTLASIATAVSTLIFSPNFPTFALLSRFARGRIPLRPVRFLLEVERRDPRPAQIRRIVDDRRDHDPLLTCGLTQQIPVLGERRLFAERNAVLAKVAGHQPCGDRLEVAEALLGRRQWRTAASLAHLPLRGGVALPRRSARWRLPLAKVQEARLRARIRFDLQGRVVLPRDAQPRWQTHQARRAIGFALVSGGSVLRRVPCIRDLLRVRVDRNAGVVTLRRGDHPPAPVLCDDGHPVAGEVDWRRRTRCRRRFRRRLPATTTPTLPLPTRRRLRDRMGRDQRNEQRCCEYDVDPAHCDYFPPRSL